MGLPNIVVRFPARVEGNFSPPVIPDSILVDILPAVKWPGLEVDNVPRVGLSLVIIGAILSSTTTYAFLTLTETVLT